MIHPEDVGALTRRAPGMDQASVTMATPAASNISATPT